MPPRTRSRLGPTQLRQFRARLAQGRQMLSAGQVHTALETLTPLESLQPNDPQLLEALAHAETEVGQYEKARHHLVELTKHSKPTSATQQMLARVFRQMGRYDDAIESVDRAMRLTDDTTELICLKAACHHLAGRDEPACELVQPLLDQSIEHPALAQVLGHLAEKLDCIDLAIAMLEKFSVDSRIRIDGRSDLFFRLGSLRNKKGDIEGSWTAYKEANRLRPTGFNRNGHAAAIQKIITDWPKETVEKLPRAEFSNKPVGAEVVFIVGMPRSGTSLLEQMLDAHPDIHGGGELHEVQRTIADLSQLLQHSQHSEVRSLGLNQKIVNRVGSTLAQRYRKHFPRSNNKASLITDKLPGNYTQLGLISGLLPGAKVIHCVRDPLDCCLSCYFQTFAGELDFTYDLRDLGITYKCEQLIMNHWKKVLDLPIIEVRYEDVVSQPEQSITKVLEFLGLSYDEACLRFYENPRLTLTASYEQVRQPLNTKAIGRHKPFDAHLGPLKEELAS